MNVIQYLTEENIEFNSVGGQEVMIVCPQCRKPKLSINTSTGLYQCFVCQSSGDDSPYAKGHISFLQKQLGHIIPITPIKDIVKRTNQEETNFNDIVERYAYELKENKSAMKYLLKRGFSEEIIEKYKLGYTTRYGEEWISIPSLEDNIYKLIKYRKLSNNTETYPKYIREKDSKSILFNGDAIKNNSTIILTEGELDALILLEHGYENVVGITGGAGVLTSYTYDQLLTMQKIFLCFDNDEAGQKAARDVWAKRLGVGRVWNVVLPKGEDVNSFLLKYGVEEFEKRLNVAHQFKVDGIISLQDTLYSMYDKFSDKGEQEIFSLPWDNVNKKIGGGLKRKDLCILGGIGGVGKTSYAMQVAYHYATVHKLPTLFFCMEMPEGALATKIIQLKFDLRIEEVYDGDMLLYVHEVEDIPIYFGYSSTVTPNIFYNTMVEVVNRYGIEFGIFDNIHRMIRDGEESSLAKATGKFKDITMDLNIPFLLIAQPRKLNTEETPTYDALKGSSALSQDADIVILIHRKRLGETETEASFSNETQIIVDKARLFSGGKTKLNFLGAKSRFDEMEI